MVSEARLEPMFHLSESRRRAVCMPLHEEASRPAITAVPPGITQVQTTSPHGKAGALSSPGQPGDRRRLQIVGTVSPAAVYLILAAAAGLVSVCAVAWWIGNRKRIASEIVGCAQEH